MEVRTRIHGNIWLPQISAFMLTLITLAAACTQLQLPKAEPFYSQSAPPPRQEFRWSNGKAPKSLDPAKAAAAPETDIVRAVFEGLTDLDAKSLREIPGVAERWKPSPDHKTWTFFLRKDARWSNGEQVTAGDFVRSWRRLADMRDKAANSYLFKNIVGMGRLAATGPSGDSGDFLGTPGSESELPLQQMSMNTNTNGKPPVTSPGNTTNPPVDPKKMLSVPAKFGVEAIDDQTLQITLETPDKDFPRLVANPVFRPVYGDGTYFEKAAVDRSIVTNGAFRIVEVGNDSILLERAEYYWNREAIELERVRFVHVDTAEKALVAYRAGSIDAITNADFEPLALKLLSPYEDFRRTTHSALNFYEFNLKNAPFSDRRVREALAVAIDRDRLTEAELEGSVEAATKFLPLSENKNRSLSFDIEHARANLVAAGYPNGTGFPVIRLLINRNDAQQRIARSVARMWKQNLNLETQIIVRPAVEAEAARAAGEYDLFRRGLVLPSVDESVSLAAIFDLAARKTEIESRLALIEKEKSEREAAKTPKIVTSGPLAVDQPVVADELLDEVKSPEKAFTELDALFEVRAIPLYFPKSYSLVKPYVLGFEMNGLDAPSLKVVSIDSTWQPKTPAKES